MSSDEQEAQQLLEEGRARGDLVVQAQALQRLGVIADLGGDTTSAERLILEALAIDVVAHGPEHSAVRQDWWCLAIVLVNRGDFARAQLAFQRCEELALRLNEHEPAARAALGLGRCLSALKDIAGTRVAFLRSLGHFDAAGAATSAAAFEANLALVHAMLDGDGCEIAELVATLQLAIQRFATFGPSSLERGAAEVNAVIALYATTLFLGGAAVYNGGGHEVGVGLLTDAQRAFGLANDPRHDEVERILGNIRRDHPEHFEIV